MFNINSVKKKKKVNKDRVWGSRGLLMGEGINEKTRKHVMCSAETADLGIQCDNIITISKLDYGPHMGGLTSN